MRAQGMACCNDLSLAELEVVGLMADLYIGIVCVRTSFLKQITILRRGSANKI